MSRTGQSQHPWTPGAARRSALGRLRLRANAVVFLASIIVIAIVILFFAHRPGLRVAVDATKTRAYSLSDQTRALLDSLEGDWVIAMLIVEENVGNAEQRQLDEVLQRYVDAAPPDRIKVLRIDPTNPQTLDQYESLLGRLRLIYARQIETYDKALDQGAASFEELTLFAQQQSRLLGQVMQRLSAANIDVRDFQQRVGLFTLLADEGGQVLTEVRKARTVDDAQPIADYETARSILAEALSQWAQQLAELGAQYLSWSQQGSIDADLRTYLGQSAQEYTALAQRMAEAADPLRHLPPIELANIGRQLRTGEAAVVVGPRSAAVIPSAQLLPRVSRGGALAFDRRFRGEQLISATIRSLLVPRMPMVVFVHNEQQSMLRRQPKDADLVGVASLLTLSRFDVREWIVADGERPAPAPQQASVWVVVPASARQDLRTSRRELQLIDAVTLLVEDGHSVLLNIYPSLLPGFNQPDPWAKLAESMHVKANTGSVIVEQHELGDGQKQIDRMQVVQNYYGDHVICRAVHGQQTVFPLPVPLEPQAGGATNISIAAVAEVEPTTSRWVEPDWNIDPSRLDEPSREQRFFQPLPIMLAVERPSQRAFGPQRFIVAGSSSWLLSAVSDAMLPLGGDRVILQNPGNQELLLASVAWLADMPELIAPSAVSQQVARLDGVTRAVWLRWFLYLAVGAPVGCLALALGVWFVRRV